MDYKLLPGKWRLTYTTAPDVRPLLFAGSGSPIYVANIYQQFSEVEQGDVQNIIEFSVLMLLRKGGSVLSMRYLTRSYCCLHGLDEEQSLCGEL